MSSYSKYLEARDILSGDGLKLQGAVECNDAIYDRYEELTLRRIYTYIKMFKVMYKMIDEDIELVLKFNPLFDALFEKYAIIALDKEWTKKDFLTVKSTLKYIHRIDEHYIEYYDTLNGGQILEMDNINDSDSDIYEEVKEEINRKLFLKEFNEMDKTNHPMNLKPFIASRPYSIKEESKRRNKILDNDNEITTKKVYDVSDQQQNIEMIIKMKHKTITISINDLN